MRPDFAGRLPNEQEQPYDNSAHRPNRSIATILLWVGGALLAFDDLGIGGVAGGLGRSPAWLALVPCSFLLRRHDTVRSRVLFRKLWGLWFYGLLITALTLSFIPQEVRGEDVIAKGFKVALTVAIWIVVFQCGYRAFRDIPEALFVGAAIGLGVMVLSAALSSVAPSMLDTSIVLHDTENIAQRIRGTRFEASSLGGAMMVCLGIMVARSTTSYASVYFALSVAGIVTITQSRGTYLTSVVLILIATLVLTLQTRNSDIVIFKPAISATTILAGLGFSFGLAFVVRSPWWSSLSAASSDATRSIWAVASSDTLASYPLGHGYSAGLLWTPRLLEDAISSVGTDFTNSDLQETSNLISSNSDVALAPKTLTGLLVMYFGIVGLFFVLIILYHLGRLVSLLTVGASVALAAGSFLMVSTSYFSSPFAWEQPLLLGMLIATSLSRDWEGGEAR